jgi:glycosyltransferase involved in cell wall biosynthesis
MNEPVVSVVMVTRNVERFLAEAIESILDQTFLDFEFIIVDYGSTDGSKALIAEYASRDSRIKFECVAPCGLAEARNAGCLRARGEYIAVMDADDVALPEKLALQVAFMHEHPQVGLLGGAVRWIGTTGAPLRVDCVPTTDSALRKELEIRCPFWAPSVLMRTRLFALVGGYREAFAPAEDYDLWLRIVEHCECANLSNVILNYRIHPHQVSMRKRVEQTRGILAARVAAASRKSHGKDPFQNITEISTEALVALGVSCREQHNSLITDHQLWIRHMCLAGEFKTALSSTQDLLRSDLRDVDRWQVANLHLSAAGLLWREKRRWQSAIELVRAVLARPLVAGRPLKNWLRRLDLKYPSA